MIIYMERGTQVFTITWFLKRGMVVSEEISYAGSRDSLLVRAPDS